MQTSANRPLIAASRAEVSAPLQVKSGSIPTDWSGHVYVSSPVGSVNSNGLPFPQGHQETGSPIMNGDGLFFRFDLTSGAAHMKTGLMKPPDYWADLATKADNANGLGKLQRFWNMGITRLSLDLGVRDLLNTAVTPFRFEGDAAPRLTACYDAGRPWEFDPVSMQLMTAIGGNQEWASSTPKELFPFPVVQSSAHPSFDPATREFFFVNFTKDMSSLLPKEALAHLLSVERGNLEHTFDDIVTDLEKVAGLPNMLKALQQRLMGKVEDTEKHAVNWLKSVLVHQQKEKAGIGQQPAEVYLLRWTGKPGPLDKWRLVDQDGKGVDIKQCMHQTAVTKDYVVLADATFKFTLDLMFNVPFSSPKLDSWLRKELTEPQVPHLDVYLVKRSDLKSGATTAKCIKLPTPIKLEAVHFSADYDNTGDRITLHLAHNSAACLAEWVRRFDRLAPDGKRAIDPEVIGLISAGCMDIGRIGKAVVNATTGNIEKYEVIEMQGNVADPEHIGAHTWGVGLYTYRDIISPDRVVPKVKHIYWSSFGMDPRLLTKFIYDLYLDYPNRAISADEMLNLTRRGIPFVLSRQDTATMQIVDHYQFSMNVILKSIQFVPKSKPTLGIDPQMDGYVFTTVLVNYPNSGGNNYQCEVWVFDGANLSKGPVCTLNSPQLDFAFTLHSAWVDQSASPVSKYHLDVRQDYDPIIAALKPVERQKPIQQLFDKFVYPNFATTAASDESSTRGAGAPVPPPATPDPVTPPAAEKVGLLKKFFRKLKKKK